MISALQIEAIPILETNYVWALHDGTHAVLVDPGRSEAALEWLAQRGLTLQALLITHHHWDHTDGIGGVLARHPVPVYGPKDSRIPSVDHPVGEGQTIVLEKPSVALEVLSVPGHTSIHLAFVGTDFVFSGDALFSAGCGRLFEGTPAQMMESLDKLAALPGDTRLYCAHEYTLDNCRFALQVEPDNPALIHRTQQVEQLRASDRITLPSTIDSERRFNPFLRTREPAVIASAKAHELFSGTQAHEIFATLRAWKDQA